MRIQVAQLDGIYHNYALYDMMYGRKAYARSQEALAIVTMVEAAMQDIVPQEDRLRVIELFSGEHTMMSYLGHYSKLFRPDGCVYTTQDGLSGGDLSHIDLFTDYVEVPGDAPPFNLALVPFYSINGAGPLSHKQQKQAVVCPPSTVHLMTLFANVGKYLGFDSQPKSKGKKRKAAALKSAMYLQFDPYPSIENLQELLADADWYIHDIPHGHPLLAAFDLYEEDDWVLKYRVHHTWDRESSVLWDHFPEGAYICPKDSPKKPFISIRFASSMFRKYWTEDQILNAMQRSGFSRFNLYNASNQPIIGGGSDFLIQRLSNTEDSEAAQVDELLPVNSILALP